MYIFTAFNYHELQYCMLMQRMYAIYYAQSQSWCFYLYTINWKDGLTPKKNCQNAAIVLSILMKNEINPWNFLQFSVWPLKIFEVKGGQHANKLEFGQTKKISIYQLFETRKCAFMIYVQFQPKSSSNLRSVVRDSKVWGHCAVGLLWPQKSWEAQLRNLKKLKCQSCFL